MFGQGVNLATVPLAPVPSSSLPFFQPYKNIGTAHNETWQANETKSWKHEAKRPTRSTATDSSADGCKAEQASGGCRYSSTPTGPTLNGRTDKRRERRKRRPWKGTDVEKLMTMTATAKRKAMVALAETK